MGWFLWICVCFLRHTLRLSYRIWELMSYIDIYMYTDIRSRIDISRHWNILTQGYHGVFRCKLWENWRRITRHIQTIYIRHLFMMIICKSWGCQYILSIRRIIIWLAVGLLTDKKYHLTVPIYVTAWRINFIIIIWWLLIVTIPQKVKNKKCVKYYLKINRKREMVMDFSYLNGYSKLSYQLDTFQHNS